MLAVLAVLAYHAPPQAPRARGTCASRVVMRDGFWDAKAARMQNAFERDEAAMLELQEREALYIERLAAAGRRTRALEAELTSMKVLQASEPQPLIAAASPAATDARITEVRASSQAHTPQARNKKAARARTR